ncbi:hypothetical protein [Bradyrhizobium sp. CCBAU 53421]|uniref:hypothetical protein n=1 Tax=Bradyrhizobium sp. CCBAU 53421 TaxID=1325120 RepID=UPI00188B7E91|nr:hypothetical protein [Bradyrhizobium sp. CCBAU 53421]
MKPLNAKVYRSGETVSQWHHETDSVSIHQYRSEKNIQISFKLASKGGGVTDVAVRIESGAGFDTLLNEMWKADPDRVVALMARQLNGHFWPD